MTIIPTEPGTGDDPLIPITPPTNNLPEDKKRSILPIIFGIVIVIGLIIIF